MCKYAAKGIDCRYFNSNISAVKKRNLVRISQDQPPKLAILDSLDPQEFLEPDGNEIVFGILSTSSYASTLHFSDECTVILGAKFLQQHELVVRRTASADSAEVFLRNTKQPLPKKFKEFRGPITKYVGIGVHVITGIIIAWYLCYVNVLRKRTGFVSRTIKDSTQFIPYTFAPESSQE